MAGRPMEYNKELIVKAKAYLDCLPEDEKMHSIEGLSDYLDIARSTLYKWIKEEGKEDFSDIVEKILNRQGKTLLNKGVSGEFNSSITKVILTKHGYRDAIDTDITSKGEKIEQSAGAAKLAQEYEDKLKEEIK